MKTLKVIFLTLLLLGTFLMCYADAVGDYRSRATGLWAPTVEFPAINWDICTVAGTPGTWTTASAAPDENAGVITIRSGHRINIELNQSADQLVVASGGILRIINNQVLTLKNGSGTDLDIQTGGTLQLYGNIYTESSTAVQISGTYTDLENCQIQGLGTVTVASGATTNTKNAYGIYLFGETIRGCYAVSSRSLNNAANYNFSSTIDPQIIYALPSTVNNLTASNTSSDVDLGYGYVELRTALAANTVRITSGSLTLGGNTSLNSLVLNDNTLNFAGYYVYFNNQHFSVGNKIENVTALTVAENTVTQNDLGAGNGTSIARTWTTSATQSNPLNVILHYPDALTSKANVNVWTRNTVGGTWTKYGVYSPSLVNGMHLVTISNVSTLNNSTGDGTLDWTISEDENTLPVELSSFTATPVTNGFLQVNWTTQSETGVMGFYIYRSLNDNLSAAQVVSPLIAATNTSQEVSYSFLDTELQGDGTYYYWLFNLDMNQTSAFHGPISVTLNSGNENPPPVIPVLTSLDKIFPNPFNPLTSISYYLAKAETVNILIYNNKGQLIRTLVSEYKPSGNYRPVWNGKDDHGQSLASGIYYVKMTAGKYTSTQKAILMK